MKQILTEDWQTFFKSSRVLNTDFYRRYSYFVLQFNILIFLGLFVFTHQYVSNDIATENEVNKSDVKNEEAMKSDIRKIIDEELDTIIEEEMDKFEHENKEDRPLDLMTEGNEDEEHEKVKKDPLWFGGAFRHVVRHVVRIVHPPPPPKCDMGPSKSK